MRCLFPLILTLAIMGGSAYADDTPDLSLGNNQNANSVASDIPDARTIPYLRVASWNVGALSTSSAVGVDKDIYSIAEIAARFDVVALQRYAPEDQLSQLLNTLQTLTGAPWSDIALPGDTTTSQTGRLAIIWRTDRVTGVAPGPSGDSTQRPQSISMSLTFGQHPFVVADVVVPESAASSKPVDKLTDYAAHLVRSFPQAPVFLACTCRASPKDPAFKTLSSFMAPANTASGTLISMAGGPATSVYDNIWTNLAVSYNSGVLPIERILNFSNVQIVSRVSSHEVPFILVTLH